MLLPLLPSTEPVSPAPPHPPAESSCSSFTKSSTCMEGGRDVLGGRERKLSLPRMPCEPIIWPPMFEDRKPKPRPRIGATNFLLDLLPVWIIVSLPRRRFLCLWEQTVTS